MKSKSEAFFINFFQKIHLKNHYFVIFSYIFVITKLLPLFIITHDWNILETKGLCKYLIELTIGPIIHRLNNFTIYIVILAILFLFSLIPVLMLIVYYHRFKKIDIYLFGKRNYYIAVWCAGNCTEEKGSLFKNLLYLYYNRCSKLHSGCSSFVGCRKYSGGWFPHGGMRWSAFGNDSLWSIFLCMVQCNLWQLPEASAGGRLF